MLCGTMHRRQSKRQRELEQQTRRAEKRRKRAEKCKEKPSNTTSHIMDNDK